MPAGKVKPATLIINTEDDRNITLECKVCRVKETLPYPMKLSWVIWICRGFKQEHEDCE